tara:strand:+ start:391 stop:1248 length:858 start_codon:yes stop_codon:yes gene_type:complete
MKDLHFIVQIGVGFGEVLSGGVLVYHKLAYEIANRGHKVTIFTTPQYPHQNINVEAGNNANNLNFDFDIDNTILIPALDWKNKIGIKNVARWVLFHVNKHDTRNIDDTDIIYNFGTFKIEDKNKNTKNKLRVIDYKTDIFYNHNKPRNKKYCFITNKDHPENWEEIFNGYDAYNLTNWKQLGAWEYLAQKFNEYEYFLTFDQKSMYPVLAALCGTKSIIINNNNITPLEYKLTNPEQLFGVAYGFGDLEWVNKTIDLTPFYVKSKIKEDQTTVNNFIKYWEDKLK